MHKDFYKKKILLFSPEFFGYGRAVANRLRDYGAAVDFYDEKPKNNFTTKALIRINKKILTKKINQYYDFIITGLKKEYYDFVFFLTPETILHKKLKLLKENQSNATFILYLWDSIQNRKNAVDLLPLFDVVYSFDKKDCEIFDFKFRPLFFLEDYKEINSHLDNTKIDLLFIGTIHSDRYEILMKLKEKCSLMEKKVDYFMYFPSKYLFYLWRFSRMKTRMASVKEFFFSPLNKGEIINKIRTSRVVVDIQHPNQTGLTMRMVEMIGARKKVITTHMDIKKYDFYNSQNILCVNRKDITINANFFETEYVDIDSELYFKYSIDGWLRDVFSYSKH